MLRIYLKNLPMETLGLGRSAITFAGFSTVSSACDYLPLLAAL
jgi:hypothetical protein